MTEPDRGEPSLTLPERLADPGRSVLLYGTTPPRAETTDADAQLIAKKLARRLRDLPVDGIVVYDIQDESGRTQLPRPFAFRATMDPRRYARMLKASTGKAIITYKSLGNLDEPKWLAWLAETADEYGAACLSIVGRPTSGVRYALDLSDAIRLAARHPAGFTVGGVVIAERHTPARSESARMLAKSAEGCSYFISQTVYHPDATVRLLNDYVEDCRRAGVSPSRVILTFAPAGRPRTIEFVKWLGVRIPPETEDAILSSPNPITRSIEVCRENLRRILEHDYVRELPLGVNVESVSINREEIDASAELVQELGEIMAKRRES